MFKCLTKQTPSALHVRMATKKGRASRRSCKARGCFAATEVAKSVDLLTEILLRVPEVKSILRFKCVSKQWYSIISDTQFTMNYSQRNPNSLLGFLLNGRSQPHQDFFFISLGGSNQLGPEPKLVNSPKIQIHHFCNGLVCYSKPHVNAPEISSYYICNSASGQSKRIRVLGPSSIKRLMAVNLAFDPSQSLSYKVIFVSETSGSELSHLIKIEIYLSETQCWRPVESLYNLYYDVGFDNGVYWNGAIYWYHYQKQILVCFSMNPDCLQRVKMPQAPNPMIFDYFGESGGHLHLVGTRRPRSTLFTVFEMQKDGSGWFEKCHGDFEALATAFPKMVYHKPTKRYVYSVVNFFLGEDEEELSFVLTIPGTVVRYNVKDKSSKKLCYLPPGCIFGEASTILKRFKGYQYIETLASI